jgi:hypothetical protein
LPVTWGFAAPRGLSCVATSGDAASFILYSLDGDRVAVFSLNAKTQANLVAQARALMTFYFVFVWSTPVDGSCMNQGVIEAQNVVEMVGLLLFTL